MTASQAKEILIEHQRLRKGLVPYHESDADFPYQQGEVGAAIEFAIQTIIMVYGEGKANEHTNNTGKNINSGRN
jgi:hypothetical protein